MRKSIPVFEAKSPLLKQLELSEKLLKELSTKSRKISLLKADDSMGDADMSKLGKVDDFNIALENAINALAKI